MCSRSTPGHKPTKRAPNRERGAWSTSTACHGGAKSMRERRVVTMQETEGQMQETKKKLDQKIDELKKEIQTSKDRRKGNRTSWKH